jgi:tripartite-type tricarboxylate transporter receptor subunit TctC
MYTRSAVGILVAVLASLSPGANAQTSAEAYPSRPVRLVVPFPPGGTIDLLARILADRLTPALGQRVIVENRPGAQGAIGIDAVAKAAPDGHTLLVMANTIVILPSLTKLPFDPIKDFAPIAPIASTPNVIAVNTAFAPRTVADFVAEARKTPGGLSYASAGTGSPLHIAGELMARATGSPLVHVPYKGVAPAVTDLVSGQVSVMFAPLGAVVPFMKTGKLALIAITDSKRSELLPQVPTLRESGVSGADVSSWFCMLAPAGTPAAAIARINTELNRILTTRDVRDRLREQFFDVTGGSPEDLGRMLREDAVRYEKVIADTGIKLE